MLTLALTVGLLAPVQDPEPAKKPAVQDAKPVKELDDREARDVVKEF